MDADAVPLVEVFPGRVVALVGIEIAKRWTGRIDPEFAGLIALRVDPDRLVGQPTKRIITVVHLIGRAVYREGQGPLMNESREMVHVAPPPSVDRKLLTNIPSANPP